MSPKQPPEPIPNPLAPTELGDPAKSHEQSYKDASMEGLEALTTLVIARDIQLNMHASPLSLPGNSADKAWKVVSIVASIPKAVLVSLIEGTLPKDRRCDDAVENEVRKLLLLSEVRPGIYVVWVVDRENLSPSPNSGKLLD